MYCGLKLWDFFAALSAPGCRAPCHPASAKLHNLERCIFRILTILMCFPSPVFCPAYLLRIGRGCTGGKMEDGTSKGKLNKRGTQYRCVSVARDPLGLQQSASSPSLSPVYEMPQSHLSQNSRAAGGCAFLGYLENPTCVHCSGYRHS